MSKRMENKPMKTLFGNLKMSRKMLINPLLIILFFCFFAFFAYMGLYTQKSALAYLFETRFENYQDIARVINKITAVHGNVYKVIS